MWHCLRDPRGYWTTRRYANSWIANSRTGQVADWTTGRFQWRLCVFSFSFFATYWCFLAVYLNTYYASDWVSCPHSLMMQLKQVLLPAASVRPRAVQSTTCPVRELTSPQDVQSVSWHIHELSKYHPCLAVSVEHWLVTDRLSDIQTRHTTTAYTMLAWCRVVKTVRITTK